MALQKQADQERERESSSLRSAASAVNVADGERQAAIKEAEGAQQSSYFELKVIASADS